MNLRSIAVIPIVAFLLLPAAAVFAQSSAEDSLFYKQAVEHLVDVYRKAAGDQCRLFNGPQYGGYPFRFANGHPFFKEEKAANGSVLYDGVFYDNVPLKYDEITDVLVLDSGRFIQLIKERVDHFSIFDNYFVRITGDSTSKESIRTGVYNVLYKGSKTLLKKEDKIIREDVSTGEILRYIDVHSAFYLKKENAYFLIKSRRDFLRLLSDKKKELRQYMRKNKLNYRKDRDNTLVKTLAYYERLTQ